MVIDGCGVKIVELSYNVIVIVSNKKWLWLCFKDCEGGKFWGVSFVGCWKWMKRGKCDGWIYVVFVFYFMWYVIMNYI